MKRDIIEIDITDMNIPERCSLEMSRPHKCSNCGNKYVGWTANENKNNVLICYCPKCKNVDNFRYWGYCNHNK